MASVADQLTSVMREIVAEYKTTLGDSLNQPKLEEQLLHYASRHEPENCAFSKDAFRASHPMGTFARTPYRGRFLAKQQPQFLRVFQAVVGPGTVDARINRTREVVEELGYRELTDEFNAIESTNAETRVDAFRTAVVTAVRLVAEKEKEAQTVGATTQLAHATAMQDEAKRNAEIASRVLNAATERLAATKAEHASAPHRAEAGYAERLATLCDAEVEAVMMMTAASKKYREAMSARRWQTWRRSPFHPV
jgi:hypothetical protein